MIKEEIYEIIEKDLEDHFPEFANEISMETNPVGDVGLDSLDVVEFIMRIEDALEVELSEEEIDSAMKAGGTIKDYVDMIEKHD